VGRQRTGISWLAWFTVLAALWIQGTDTFLAVKDLAENQGLVRRAGAQGRAWWLRAHAPNRAAGRGPTSQRPERRCLLQAPPQA
jgi:hypothetical protein